MTMATQLPASTPLFNVPDKLVKILDRDLAVAGIAKRDERGRTIDDHALRHIVEQGGRCPTDGTGRDASFVD